MFNNSMENDSSRTSMHTLSRKIFKNTSVSLNNHGSSSTLNYVPDSEKAVFEDRMDVEATMAKVKRRMS